MNNIDKELKDILNEEQNNIIKSDEKYIMVSACPGAGKTYTIVRKIEKELETIKEFQGIIACSFSNEAANELKSRINKSIDTSQSYIGTIDSFVLKFIIGPFINRYLKEKGELDEPVKINSIVFPENYNEINLMTRLYDKSLEVRKNANEYCITWMKTLKNGEYEISFPTYLLAAKIVKMKIFNEYFSDRYTSLYIDEAQDLNFFQHILINEIKNNTNINIIMVGDPNQSIYQFRGARPELFNDLINKGYHKYNIDVSVRCHASIMYYANKIFNSSLTKTFEDNHVKIIDNINLELLRKMEENIYILTENNSTAISLYEEFKDDYDIIYSKKLDLNNKEFNLNRDIIEELIRFYLNYDNIEDKYKYPIDQLMIMIQELNKKVKRNDFKIKNRALNEYLEETTKSLNILLSEDTINEIVKKLEDEKYKYAYYVCDKNNRIMTIHSSKGLEANNIVIVLESWKIDEAFKNKLFVAITRAKENVYIYYAERFAGKEFVTNLLK